MDVSLHCWSIPPRSRLYARLREDQSFYAILSYLFPYGSGIYQLFDELTPGEIEDLFGDLVRRRRLGPEPEARRQFNAFRIELDRTRAEFPGVERRVATLEKTSLAIEERLTQELKRTRTDAAEFTRALLFGDELPAPHPRPGETTLGLVPLPLVRDGAAVLDRVRPDELFPAHTDRDDGCRNDYAEWRELYLEAAHHAEELLVGVA